MRRAVLESLPKATARADGFTLLELIVAISILALVSVVLAGGLRFGVAAWEKGSDAARRTSELQIAQRLLRRHIEQMRPVSLTDRGRQKALAMEGTPAALRFVGSPPGHLSPPGLYLMEVALKRGSGTAALVLSWRRLQPDLSDFEQTEDVESTVLIEGIAAGAFAYFGKIDERDPPQWRDQWADHTVLPRLVRLTIRYPQGDPRSWPALVVAPQVQALR